MHHGAEKRSVDGADDPAGPAARPGSRPRPTTARVGPDRETENVVLLPRAQRAPGPPADTHGERTSSHTSGGAHRGAVDGCSRAPHDRRVGGWAAGGLSQLELTTKLVLTFAVFLRCHNPERG